MVEQIRQGDIPGVQLRCRQLLKATPREIWTWLTESDLQSRWLAQRARLGPDPGKALLLETTDADGITERENWVTVVSDPPHRWVVDLRNLDGTWPVPTRVTFELTATLEGTELSVLQSGFAHLPLSNCLTIWEAYRHRWRTALSTLADRVSSPAGIKTGRSGSSSPTPQG